MTAEITQAEYPAWICSRCGSKHGKHSRPWSTWHADTCGWCGKYTSCTEPRDFGYPSLPADTAADLAFDLVPGPAANALIKQFAKSAKKSLKTTPTESE